MKYALVPVIAVLVALTACNETTTPSSTDNSTAANPSAANPTTPTATPTEAPLLPQRDAAASGKATAETADNSARNLREDGSQLTPLDQGESEMDRGITQGIRTALVARSELSMNAKNVKIITKDGVVVLRGPVTDPRERDTIAAVAAAESGVKRVDNQLEPLN